MGAPVCMDSTDTQGLLARLSCCEKGDRYIRIREAHAMDGPEHTGWCIALASSYDPVWENVALCPWCGKRVPGVGERGTLSVVREAGARC